MSSPRSPASLLVRNLFLAATEIFGLTSGAKALAHCSPSAPAADVTCFGAQPNSGEDAAPAINAAVGQAVKRHVPLVLPAGRYTVKSTVDIDYAEASDTGIEIQGNGSILDGQGAAVDTVLRVHCSGGTPQAPKACFYLHLAGTLHVYTARDQGWGVMIGNIDLSDTHNSAKIDQLDVNNSGSNAGGTYFGQVLNADAFVISNAGPYSIAFWLQQVQFSTIKGSAATRYGWALYLGDEGGYTFANTLVALDLENSEWCVVNTNSKVAHNTFWSPYFNCAHGVYSAQGSDVLLNPLFGTGVQDRGRLDGFQILP